CKRKWEEDRDTVIEGLKRLSDYPEYMWFLLYCEGTRFTETKHRVSMEVAVSKGLPPLKYHLLPRTKGFTTAVQCLRGTVAAVYDVTLNFRGNKNPSLLGILYGKKYEADMCVR
uniref:Phospholipid/glycerol acyltransferase domain-containing protein n=2 Tax=Propithecus coquereli TaxID=379532 RepID=A0A2K6FAS3_PROCO